MQRSGSHFRPKRWSAKHLFRLAVLGTTLALSVGASTGNSTPLGAPLTAATGRQVDDTVLVRVATPRLVTADDVVATVSFAPKPTTTTTSTTSTTAAPPTTTTTKPSPATTAAPFANANTGQFAVAAGAKLPSEADCAKAVTKAKEMRPGNATANKTKPNGKAPTQGNWGSNPTANTYLGRVSGNYTGTTDEIIQWASCKWGFAPDITRAQAMVESAWNQGATAGVKEDQAECAEGLTAPCPTAFGLLQLRSDHQPGTYPYSAQSTAFNLDYSLALRRACYDGVSWLKAQPKGDVWACVGVHYSGNYLDDPAKSYIAKVQAVYAKKSWPH